MTSKARLRLAHAGTASAALIAGIWLYTLYPMLTRTGPSPGAGAQYVFLMLPTVGIATLLALGSTVTGAHVLRSDPQFRGPLHTMLVFSSAALTTLLVSFWIRFALRASSAL